MPLQIPIPHTATSVFSFSGYLPKFHRLQKNKPHLLLVDDVIRCTGPRLHFSDLFTALIYPATFGTS